MKNILSLLLVSAIIIGCGENRILIDEIIIKNQLSYNEDGLYSGVVFDLFENGNLEFEYAFNDGRMTGIQKVW